jgi:UDP-N-acetylmuramate--alanine ligase
MKKEARVHFIGIGGVSMSGIAIELSRQGMIISGSDVSNTQTNGYLRQCANQGIKLFLGHSNENISPETDLVVITSTVQQDNPEVIRAKQLEIPVLQRFEIINIIVKDYTARIGVFGGAGKTTTTALCWFLFKEAGLNPSLFLGSILKNLECSVHLEKHKAKDICIFETDESDASVYRMPMNSGILVALEADHLEHKLYGGSYSKMKDYFKDLLLKLRKEKSPVCYNSDNPEVVSLIKETMKGYTYLKSFSILDEKANFYACNFNFTYGGTRFDIYENGNLLASQVFLPLIGEFNALNFLGCISMLSFFVISREEQLKAIEGMKNFEGIDKRQVKVGEFGGFDIIDDYAHSPLKIKALLSGFSNYIKSINGGMIAICEIHKFSRLDMMYNEYLTCFKDAKFLILMDIYKVAGYTGPKPDIYKLIEDIKHNLPHLEIMHISNENLPRELLKLMKNPEFKKNKHNFLLFFGAGLSSQIAKEMQGLLEKEESLMNL